MSQSEHPQQVWDNIYASPMDFADSHDAYYHLIPFDHIGHNPWEALLGARDHFDGLHDYASVWKIDDIEEFPRYLQGERVRFYVATLGSYMVKEAISSGPARYLNPQYQNEMPLECVLDRDEQLEYYSHHALVTGEDVDEMFNMGNGWAYKTAERRGIDWDARMKRGREKLANTMKIAYEWTDITHRELGRAIGKDQSNATRWMHQYASLDDAPERPHEKWSGSDRE